MPWELSEQKGLEPWGLEFHPKRVNQYCKVRKRVKIRKRYNQVPHLTQDNNEKVTNSQLDITNESQEVSLFPAGDHKATINRHAQKHSKHTTDIR